MPPKSILLLFCAFVAAMENDEPLHKFSAAKPETWKQLAIMEVHVLKELEKEFNKNLENFDAELKATLKPLNEADPKKTFNELATKCETDVLDKSFQKYAMGPVKLDYEKIAMQAVRNYYKLMWYFIVDNVSLKIRSKNDIFQSMWPFLDAGHRDFGPDYSVPYYKPPLMNRDEPLELCKRIDSERFVKCRELLHKRIVNWAVYRYLKQDDAKRLKAIGDYFADALERGSQYFSVHEISLNDAKADFGGDFPFPNKDFQKELETALRTFIKGLNVQIRDIKILNNSIDIYLKS